MIVVEKRGHFLPSKLATELRTAGVNVAGVTCTEDEEGAIVAVQVIVDADKADSAAIDAVCGAHDAAPAEEIEVKRQQPVDARQVLVDALEQLPPDKPFTASDLLAILEPGTEPENRIA